jgi:hypothetical protein
MRQRPRDKRYRDGVDRGRMATQSLPLPVKKDYKPATPKPPSGAVKIIVETNGGETKTIPFETLPKQIQRHILAKVDSMGKKK